MSLNRAKLAYFGRPPIPEPPSENIILAQTGATALDLTPFATAANGNLMTLDNSLGGEVFLKLGDMPSGALPEYPEVLAIPGASWNGTAGTGGTEPTVPAEASGMPTASCQTMNFERFVAKGYIDFLAYHRDGVATVEAWVEGEIYDLPPIPRLYAFPGYDDDPDRIAALHRLTVDFDNFPMDGDFRVYLHVISSNPAAPERWIGPFQFNRKTGAYYDAEILQDPSQPNVTGVSYDTPQAAMVYLSTHPELRFARIKATQTHTVDFLGVANGGTWRAGAGFTATRQGMIDFYPEGGVTVTWENNTSARMSLRMLQEGVRYRKGMRIDARNIGYNHDQATLRPHAIAGGEVFSSLGALDYSGATGDPAQGYPNTILFGQHFYLYEAHWHDIVSGPTGARCHRFCNVHDVTSDCVNPASGQASYFNYGTKVDDVDIQAWRIGPDAITLRYNGAATTATWSVSGNDFRLHENGSVAHTITRSTTQGSGIYTTGDLVNEINTKADWVATLVSGDWRATSVGFVAGNTGNSNCKGITQTIKAGFDIHGDGVQLASSLYNNFQIICAPFTGALKDFVTWFFDAQVTGQTLNINMVNSHSSADTITAIPQVSNAHGGLVFAHVTAPACIVWFRGGTDGSDYIGDQWGLMGGCLLYRVLQKAGGSADQGDIFPIRGMAVAEVQGDSPPGVYVPGAPLPGLLATGNYYDFTIDDVLPNWQTGDFKPVGVMEDGTHLIQAEWHYDIDFRPRATLTTPGTIENYARIPAGNSVEFPVEWAQLNGVYAVTDGATPGSAVGSFTLSAKAGDRETGSTIAQEYVFDVV